MERYFKISENELVELIARDWRLGHIEAAGVDNWEDGGMISEFFNEACKEAGFQEKENESYWYDYTYEDLARTMLKDYQEIT